MTKDLHCPVYNKVCNACDQAEWAVARQVLLLLIESAMMFQTGRPLEFHVDVQLTDKGLGFDSVYSPRIRPLKSAPQEVSDFRFPIPGQKR